MRNERPYDRGKFSATSGGSQVSPRNAAPRYPFFTVSLPRSFLRGELKTNIDQRYIISTLKMSSMQHFCHQHCCLVEEQ